MFINKEKSFESWVTKTVFKDGLDEFMNAS